jgi:undecaprenyl-diphosphatase
MMSPSRSRLFLTLGGAALALLIFVRITRELMEGDVAATDRAFLLTVARVRTPWLTAAAVDITALGSVTLVVLFTAFALVVLLVLRDRMAVCQLLAAATGAAILTIATKDSIERMRPEEIPRLIAVSGFSYPSGHSAATSAIYLTICMIASRHVRHSGVRAAMFPAVVAVVMMVAASRVYLGIHYLTDVVSGVSLGLAWALLLAGCFAFARDRSSGLPGPRRKPVSIDSSSRL